MKARLTNRQAQVLRLVAEGLTDRQIAAQLWISVRTANEHVHSAMTVLGAATRAQAVYLAFVADSAGKAPPMAVGPTSDDRRENRASDR